ncbi:MAG: YmdB family metallophosphoesterase [Spirochaetes bacterium]|nr:YmdB family metallophosphoesterase [Spirochaetota bacterium]
MLKVLFLGEIIGIPTVRKLKKCISQINEQHQFDLIIANADGASDGYGLLSDTAKQIRYAGVNIITGGDFIFNKKDAGDLLDHKNFVLRPYNLPPTAYGRGYLYVPVKNDQRVGILNLLGRTNFNKIFAHDPFYSALTVVEKLKETVSTIIVDFHGGTTSEIQAMHWHLAGKVSLVIGTHLRVLTADERILNDYTGIITGAGFCGAANSIYGLSPEIEIKKIRTGQFSYSKIEKGEITLQGIIAEIDETSGKTESIQRINQSFT